MKILCFHQSAELYGSDRSFALCLKTLRQGFPKARIDVVLPEDGPLRLEVEKHVDGVRFRKLVKLQKRDIRYGLVNKLVLAVFRCRSLFKLAQGYEILYLNTAVLLDVLLLMRYWRRKKIIHVREIPTGMARYLFSFLIRLSKADVIFNSEATKAAFDLSPKVNSQVVLNGIKGYSDITEPAEFQLPLKILLIGRINSWKGQGLLLEALSLLSDVERESVRVRIVGSAPPGQEHFLKNLHDLRGKLDLQDIVEIAPFNADPSLEFEWSDIVVVPSVKPEPFGLVAIEGLSAGRLVIAANHGGLKEIIQNGNNGILFAPNDAKALSDCVSRLVAGKEHMKEMALLGKDDFMQKFSEASFTIRFLGMFA